MGRKPVYVASQMLLFDNDLLTATSEVAPIGSAGYVEPDKDGITPERFEEIIVPVPKNARCNLRITIAQGDSGNWYFGRDIHVGDNGSGYAPWPKFSDKFGSREVCIAAAADNISNYLEKEKSLKPEALKSVKKALCELQPEEPTAVDEKMTGELKLVQKPPQPAPNQALVVEEKVLTFKQLSKTGYSRDEAKVLMAGFFLVKYIRKEKKVLLTCQDPRLGWYLYGIFPTFAGAEQVLKEQLAFDGSIEAFENGTITMRGKNSTRLYAAGFDFYRNEGINEGECTAKIKQASKNWGTWRKFQTGRLCQVAWAELMRNVKALEG